MLVQPESILRWHRALVRRKWAALGRRRGPGRPSLDRKLLRRHRIGPAPLRSRLSWKALLRAHASAIVLTDFLSVDTVLLKRFYVLLYVELATRRVIWFAVTDRPDAAWVSQQARNVCWELSAVGVDARFLVHDHDAKYGGGSDLVFRAEGIEVMRTPIAAPKAKAHTGDSATIKILSRATELGQPQSSLLLVRVLTTRRYLGHHLYSWSANHRDA